jgi:peptidyl-prolyl cis-trans isomerase C
MKTCILFAIVSVTLFAQTPGPPGALTPDTVVVTVNGKGYTAAEIRKIVEPWPPNYLQQLKTDPVKVLQSIFLIRSLAEQGEKLKLAEESPWKDQIEVGRMQVVANALITHERNSFPVRSEDIDAYYDRNRARYEQAKVKVIKISFKPAIPGTATSPTDVQKAAQLALQNAHSSTGRTETEAKTIAADLVKQLRAGADFVKLVAEHSDDADSKAAGGDFGMVRPNSPYPDDMKKAVFALKPGEVSDPVPQSNAFYIIRVEEKLAQPINEVREAIISEIRDAHAREYGSSMAKQFTPQLTRPEFFLMPGAIPAGKPPAEKP